MIKSPHTINGKFCGYFYELDSGKKLYLAHRTPGKMLAKKSAWTMDDSLLRKCQAMGIEAVGVVVRKAGKPAFYVTHIEDFFDPLKSFSHFKDAPQRGLSVKWFRVHPGNRTKTLDRITRV